MAGVLAPVDTGNLDGMPSVVMTRLRQIEAAINSAVTAGNSTSTFGGQGNIAVQTSAAGVQPSGTAADIVLAVATIPAGAFDIANRSVTITANGSFVSNTNAKRVKVIFGATTAVVGSAVTGGTAIMDSGSVATTAAAGGWQAQASVYKYGAGGSNTQIGLHQQFQSGNATATMIAPSLLTAPENALILVAITGNAATATTDIIWNQLELNWND